jgi:hypothetical protein
MNFACITLEDSIQYLVHPADYADDLRWRRRPPRHCPALDLRRHLPSPKRADADRKGRQKSERPPPLTEPRRDSPTASIWLRHTTSDLPMRTASIERHHLPPMWLRRATARRIAHPRRPCLCSMFGSISKLTKHQLYVWT